MFIPYCIILFLSRGFGIFCYFRLAVLLFLPPWKSDHSWKALLPCLVISSLGLKSWGLKSHPKASVLQVGFVLSASLKGGLAGFFIWVLDSLTENALRIWVEGVVPVGVGGFTRCGGVRWLQLLCLLACSAFGLSPLGWESICSGPVHNLGFCRCMGRASSLATGHSRPM